MKEPLLFTPGPLTTSIKTKKSMLVDYGSWDDEFNSITAKIRGKVVKIVDFGAFVNILPGKDGLLHVSEISSERVENVSDVLSEGDIIKVKLIGFDRGKMKLSKKVLDQ